jgi:hypothetical protein
VLKTTQYRIKIVDLVGFLWQLVPALCYRISEVVTNLVLKLNLTTTVLVITPFTRVATLLKVRTTRGQAA